MEGWRFGGCRPGEGMQSRRRVRWAALPAGTPSPTRILCGRPHPTVDRMSKYLACGLERWVPAGRAWPLLNLGTLGSF